MEQLDYQLEVTYSYSGSKIPATCSMQGSFFIGEMPPPQYPESDPATGDAMTFTVDPETKEICNKDFIGRNAEKQSLHSLVAGPGFANYKNALLYGLRRTGKTSLLNYFKEYVGVHCPNELCFYLYGQGANNTSIKSFFVDDILKKLSLLHTRPDWLQSDEWSTFYSKWTNKTECSPIDFPYFFEELYYVTGQGLILIVDEVDVLFASLNLINTSSEDTVTDTGFLAALGSIINNPSEHHVRFVLCGSNWLIRYMNSGHELEQVFQRIPHKIPVGQLNRRAFDEVLRSLHKEDTFTKEAMDLIWDCTEGLVWFVKTIAIEIFRTHRQQGKRDIFYPCNVLDALSSIIGDLNCKHFYEGIKPGEPEYELVMALKNLAGKMNASIPIETLFESLTHGPNPERWLPSPTVGDRMQKLAKPLKQLTQYSILKQVPGEEERYRFSIDLYRRYFRTFVTPNYSYEKSSDERFFIKEESTRVSSAVDFYTDEEF